MGFSNFLFGLFVIAIGVGLLRFNFKLTNSFSRSNWFERNLGSGSTYIVFQLVAVLAVILGVLIMFGLGDNVMEWIFSPIRGIFNLND